MGNRTPKEKLFAEVVEFSEYFFSTRDHFVCVYGSYASGHHTDVSDMDMFVAVKDHSVEHFEQFREFLIDLHVRHSLNLDDEVPYENKLMMSYDDVEHAIALDAFQKVNTGYKVPPVEKKKEFLTSPEIRWRLLLNALTSPHEYVYGNQARYNEFKDKAEKALITLAYGLSEHLSPQEEHLFEVLTTGSGGEEGEMYLGYKKERDSVITYLKELIKKHH